MPNAAVIIPHYNDTVRLQRCLAALVPQLTPDIEVILVDNGSTEDLSGIRQAYPTVRLIVEPSRGAAEARNRGVHETDAEFLFFLDSDCVPAANWCSVAMSIARRSDVIGGRVDVFDETPPPRSGAQAFETVFAFDNRSYVESKKFSVTANLLTRREVFLQTGPFRAGRSEDLDWCHRAQASGFRLVYAHELQVAHPTREDWPALRRKWRRLTDEGFAMHDREKLARLRWGIKGLAMPLSIAWHMPRVLRHPGLRGADERLRAVGTLARLRLIRMVWILAQAASAR